MQKATHENDTGRNSGPPKPIVEDNGRSAQTVLCPFCHSQVSSEAGRCPFCNGWLDQGDRANQSSEQPRHSRLWAVIVENHTYGPYDLDEMQELIEERRVAPHSYVSKDGGATLQAAAEDPVLAALFDAAKAVSAAQFEDANNIELTSAQSDGRAGTDSGNFSRFMIAADVKWSVSRFESALFALGPSYQIMELVWILSTDKDFPTVRKALVRTLGGVDRLFIGDLTHEKIAWFNMGQKVECRIRDTWIEKSLQRDTDAVPENVSELV